MMFPLVRELADKSARIRVPVSVTCRVLKLFSPAQARTAGAR